MSINKGLFSSQSDEWCTPKVVYDFLDKWFDFDLDAAASKDNALNCFYFSAENSALENKWFGNVFCNPPYSRFLQRAFIQKAIEEVQNENAAKVVMLLPARFDTKNWHELLFPNASEVWFIKGRLNFGGSVTNASAPFPSCIVVLEKLDAFIKFKTWEIGTVPSDV